MKLAYLTEEDILSVFEDSRVFAIQAPPGTFVEIGAPPRVCFIYTVYQIKFLHISSVLSFVANFAFYLKLI